LDLERHRPGKLELLTRLGYVLPPNFGGQAEEGSLGKILAGRTEAPFGLRGNVGLLLRCLEFGAGAHQPLASNGFYVGFALHRKTQ
jgi:hypothetical protein